jgi:hypothetical protein
MIICDVMAQQNYIFHLIPCSYVNKNKIISSPFVCTGQEKIFTVQNINLLTGTWFPGLFLLPQTFLLIVLAISANRKASNSL